MALAFGTSGVRGLVTDMTDRECYLYATAFVRYVKDKSRATAVALAGDHRSSTERIAKAVAYAIRHEGLEVDYCGKIPTPAVMNYGIQNHMASIMVTGSHIPDDRNGIKFNMPWGEVLKREEREISGRYTAVETEEEEKGRAGTSIFHGEGGFRGGIARETGDVNPRGRHAYIRRFTDFFQPGCLRDLRILFYQHSSVSRDILPEILRQLGAEVRLVGRSESFMAVDTEAVEATDTLARWVMEVGADALVSTDGDGDRPLVVDEKGKIVRGDVLGILVSDYLGADSVSATVSCSTALEKCGRFAYVIRTQIGSPYVIASMGEALQAGRSVVVGYEANGGFLTASDIVNPETHAVLRALPTRDAGLPIVAILADSRKRGRKISGRVQELPPRFTASGLLRRFPITEGRALIRVFQARGKDFANRIFSSSFGPVESLDFTDGARLMFISSDIVHLRPSGNAPEFRCYTESSTEDKAIRNNHIALRLVGDLRAKLKSL